MHARVYTCVCTYTHTHMWGQTWEQSDHNCYRKAEEELDSFRLHNGFSGNGGSALALKVHPSRINEDRSPREECPPFCCYHWYSVHHMSLLFHMYGCV